MFKKIIQATEFIIYVVSFYAIVFSTYPHMMFEIQTAATFLTIITLYSLYLIYMRNNLFSKYSPKYEDYYKSVREWSDISLTNTLKELYDIKKIKRNFAQSKIENEWVRAEIFLRKNHKDKLTRAVIQSIRKNLPEGKFADVVKMAPIYMTKKEIIDDFAYSMIKQQKFLMTEIDDADLAYAQLQIEEIDVIIIAAFLENNSLHPNMAKFLHNLMDSGKPIAQYFGSFDETHYIDRIKKITTEMVYISNEKQLFENVAVAHKSARVQKI